MRISDWSSDVCSSDLHTNKIFKAIARPRIAVRLESQHDPAVRPGTARGGQRGGHLDRMMAVVVDDGLAPAAALRRYVKVAHLREAPPHSVDIRDRKSVESGKSVS